ncbi:ubiquitin-2 like rad60 SUMO-like domain-containing protein [Pochonia chlamydosporia 170]|uniref:Ubiquitin-2 like rad60 SUMO-like domain-containing protein n=1 Tax=Pochonia chlamydosporia 170 TaxID=1380566 RepID=A0A179FFA3_METCM|nr:ubiquitin-2 like rad60 SUMO-like domain-containing protein [Pochonia chlamydosporia 170]OAQ64206.1 ubiquitin-2 like rad60 SUMO-like domain-containing protein [Pochonia chlamydosporia 170]
MSNEDGRHSSQEPNENEASGPLRHLNLKVTDNNNEVFFKIKSNTPLQKLMTAFCDRQGKDITSLRFLLEGVRINAEDTADILNMEDGDTIEVHQEQIGGGD